MEGFLLIDKPAGITSHDVVYRVRRATGVKRVGHAGTLDPFATGLLIVGVGRSATKRLGEFLGADKEYEATLRLGATSDTQDLTGVITPVMNPAPVGAGQSRSKATGSWPSREEILAALKKFSGEIEQIPPMYSAKKIAGKKLYELARAGQVVERQPAKITIHEIELKSFTPPEAVIRVRCSSGTYVRTLAHDLGQTLGCGAYLTALRRTAIGGQTVSHALPLAELSPKNWQTRLLPA
ncbi:MAG: tRNA pseudouridine(55) synthase TruB [Patescibacteria group bacterium]|nr:tRNA pseudouridine(55) synthase TruB [Patescibacteria group bacterium]